MSYPPFIHPSNLYSTTTQLLHNHFQNIQQPRSNHDSTIFRVESKNDFDTTIPQRNSWSGVGLADGVAEVALVSAVELAHGGEVHGFRNFTCCGAAFEPPPNLFKPRILYCLVERLAACG